MQQGSGMSSRVGKQDPPGPRGRRWPLGRGLLGMVLGTMGLTVLSPSGAWAAARAVGLRSVPGARGGPHGLFADSTVSADTTPAVLDPKLASITTDTGDFAPGHHD